jgi:hypothetical protein
MPTDRKTIGRILAAHFYRASFLFANAGTLLLESAASQGRAVRLRQRKQASSTGKLTASIGQNRR